MKREWFALRPKPRRTSVAASVATLTTRRRLAGRSWPAPVIASSPPSRHRNSSESALASAASASRHGLQDRRLSLKLSHRGGEAAPPSAAAAQSCLQDCRPGCPAATRTRRSSCTAARRERGVPVPARAAGSVPLSERQVGHRGADRHAARAVKAAPRLRHAASASRSSGVIRAMTWRATSAPACSSMARQSATL